MEDTERHIKRCLVFFFISLGVYSHGYSVSSDFVIRDID